jgi:hypothetical protein
MFQLLVFRDLARFRFPIANRSFSISSYFSAARTTIAATRRSMTHRGKNVKLFRGAAQPWPIHPVAPRQKMPNRQLAETGYGGRAPFQIGIPPAEKFYQRLIISGNLVQANWAEDL